MLPFGGRYTQPTTTLPSPSFISSKMHSRSGEFTCPPKSRVPTCYLHRTYYSHYWLVAANRWVVCPPPINIWNITAAVDQLLHRRVGCPPLINIRNITAAVDQLLHTEELVPTCCPHQKYYCRCWSAATHRKVGCPPIIHIGQITAAVDQLLHREE